MCEWRAAKQRSSESPVCNYHCWRIVGWNGVMSDGNSLKNTKSINEARCLRHSQLPSSNVCKTNDDNHRIDLSMFVLNSLLITSYVEALLSARQLPHMKWICKKKSDCGLYLELEEFMCVVSQNEVEQEIFLKKKTEKHQYRRSHHHWEWLWVFYAIFCSELIVIRFVDCFNQWRGIITMDLTRSPWKRMHVFFDGQNL